MRRRMTDAEKDQFLWLRYCHKELMNVERFEPMKLDVVLSLEIASEVPSINPGP